MRSWRCPDAAGTAQRRASPTTTKASGPAHTPLPRAPHETPRLPARTPLPPPPPPEVECGCCYDCRARDTGRGVARGAGTVCEGCVRHLVQARIGEGSASLTCLAGGAGCKAPLPHKAVAQALASPCGASATPSSRAGCESEHRRFAELPLLPLQLRQAGALCGPPEGVPVRAPHVRQAVPRGAGRNCADKPHACPESEETDALTDAVIRDCRAARRVSGLWGATRWRRPAPPSRATCAGN